MSKGPDPSPTGTVEAAAALRREWLERMRSRDNDAVNLALSWASATRPRLRGRLRPGTEPASAVDDETAASGVPLEARMREPGQSWHTPSKVGRLLGLFPNDLAARLGVDVTQFAEWPPRVEVKAALSMVVDVLTLATDWLGDEERAIAWYLHAPLEPFSGRTADFMIGAGKGGAVAEYLRSLRSNPAD